ncbi:MAG: hypothetical protein AABZ47_14005 [Planctomycetota bacterium]
MARYIHAGWLFIGVLMMNHACGGRAAAQCEFPIGPPVTGSDGLEQDLFGVSVALDGSTAVMGAPGDDHAGDASGSAYAFILSGGAWSQQQKLIASDAVADDFFGFDVALSGNIALVGAYGVDDAGVGADVGAVYVFNRSGAVWTQTQKLVHATPVLYEEFGHAVAMDTTTAMIGAPFNALFREEKGSVFVFIRVGATWSIHDNFDASDGFIDDRFGYALALNASTAVVGTQSGGAYVFQRTGDTWSEQQKLVSPDSGAGFGEAVAVRGDFALIGAPWDGAGSAYVFTRSAGVWTFQQKLTSASATAGFGISVAMEGNLAVIGASLDDTAAGASAGATYLFLNTGGVWTEEARLTANNGASGDQFGSDVAVTTGRALIGAMFGDKADGANSGSAYIVNTRTPDCNTNGVLDVCDIANGASPDCNLNQVPDECDLAQGTSLDCSGNGVPDECDQFVCDDGNLCTDDTCNGTDCVFANNTRACDDGLFCNGLDTCAGGTCSAHGGNPCASGGECADACNEAADHCFDPSGTACTDDGNVCTDNRCDGAGVCAALPNIVPCDDGLFCNGSDTCAGGTCSGHSGDPCIGGGECADACNEAADNCFDPWGALCTDDGNVCTDNKCDGAGVCAAVLNSVPCDDGDNCTVRDVCVNGDCVGIQVLHGDITPPGGDGVVDLDDLIILLNGFADYASFPEADIYPCEGPNGITDLDDLIALLGAFAGSNVCPHPCPP